MPDFLYRRASTLIDEARALDAAGAGRVACERVSAACELLEQSFGPSHRQLPELFELLSDLHHRLGEADAATRFQTRAWEVRHRRARRSRRFLAVARLDPSRTLAAAAVERWPVAASRLLERIRGDTLLEAAPEVLIFGPPRSGKTHLLNALGHEAIDRPWSTRLDQGYELVESLAAARRALTFRRCVERLDRYSILLVDEVDPWGLTRTESELLHTALLHRRERRCTVLAIRTGEAVASEIFLDRIRSTRALRYPSPEVVMVGLPAATPARS